MHPMSLLGVARMVVWNPQQRELKDRSRLWLRIEDVECALRGCGVFDLIRV